MLMNQKRLHGVANARALNLGVRQIIRENDLGDFDNARLSTF